MLRILAFDIGERRIGVAVSDPLGITAQGIETYHRTDDLQKDVDYLIKLANGYKPVKLVFGMPRNMDGSSGPMVDKVKAFGRQLAERKPELVLEYWDERLTTAAAQRVLVDADMSRSRRRKVVDKVAASLILQGYMDLRARRASSVPT